MTDFWFYIQLGFNHVLDWNAYDHVLFILVLVAVYTFKTWKKALLLITLFTIGHSLSLLLANYNLVAIAGKWIEFLIPVTIIFAAIYNFIVAKKTHTNTRYLIYLITFFFGIIHGFGFASYYKMIYDETSVTPLLSFALGIEASQIVIVLAVLAAAFLFQKILHVKKREWIIGVSAIVIGRTIPMLTDSWPF
ncbi:HupE/UreJ family protein [Jejudonia soesokkakensis]|uniref:HupE/UreJ family protein n=1 Tax=Jejudonia soesokkakensis TaxID=1323432 RepID=A0ABW2MVW1_9FLAO